MPTTRAVSLALAVAITLSLAAAAHAQQIRVTLPDWSAQAKEVEEAVWGLVADIQDGKTDALVDALADPAMIVSISFEGGATETQVVTAANHEQVHKWMAAHTPPPAMVFEAVEVTMFGPNAGVATMKVSLPTVEGTVTVASATLVRTTALKGAPAAAAGEPEWRIATMVLPG